MKTVVLFASITLASGLMLTNIYNSIVDARSWGFDIPQSIETARQYFKSVNPGNFFRVFSPINQVLALIALILFWKWSPSIRIYLAVALLLYILADVFTFAYFYPRNNIMFSTARLNDIDTLKRAWQGWSIMNWLRSAMLFVGLVFSFLALHKIYTTK